MFNDEEVWKRTFATVYLFVFSVIVVITFSFRIDL